MIEETKGEHYPKLDPWKLQEQMKSSGFASVDARRCDAIKYAFRMKGGLPKLLHDLKKSRHCLTAAIETLEKKGIAAEEGGEPKSNSKKVADIVDSLLYGKQKDGIKEELCQSSCGETKEVEILDLDMLKKSYPHLNLTDDLTDERLYDLKKKVTDRVNGNYNDALFTPDFPYKDYGAIIMHIYMHYYLSSPYTCKQAIDVINHIVSLVSESFDTSNIFIDFNDDWDIWVRGVLPNSLPKINPNKIKSSTLENLSTSIAAKISKFSTFIGLQPTHLAVSEPVFKMLGKPAAYQGLSVVVVNALALEYIAVPYFVDGYPQHPIPPKAYL